MIEYSNKLDCNVVYSKPTDMNTVLSPHKSVQTRRERMSAHENKCTREKEE